MPQTSGQMSLALSDNKLAEPKMAIEVMTDLLYKYVFLRVTEEDEVNQISYIIYGIHI